jgi:CBS domain containing-hemolysin-like protein
VGVRRSRVRRLAEDGNVFARWLLPNVETPVALDRYVGGSQIGITLSSLVLGAYAQATVTTEATTTTITVVIASIRSHIEKIFQCGTNFILIRGIPFFGFCLYLLNSSLSKVLFKPVGATTTMRN